MADLTQLQAAQAVKITGADSTGLENNAVTATATGDLSTSAINYTKVDFGKYFLASTDLQNITVTTETRFLLLRNPTGSGKVVKIDKLWLISYASTAGNNSNNTIFRFYKNPTFTGTGGGTSMTVTGAKTTGQNANSALLAYLPTTVTANGTLFQLHRVNSSQLEQVVDLKGSFWIEENQSLLITAQILNATNNSAVSLQFWEE
jgi:hypothetical protein